MESDIKVKRVVEAIRANWFPKVQPTLSQRQNRSRRDLPVSFPIWISRTTFSVSPNNLLQSAFIDAVSELSGEAATAASFSLPTTDVVDVEWNGLRKSTNGQQSALSERNKFDCLKQDATSDLAILYVHGGSYMSVQQAVTTGLLD